MPVHHSNPPGGEDRPDQGEPGGITYFHSGAANAFADATATIARNRIESSTVSGAASVSLNAIRGFAMSGSNSGAATAEVQTVYRKHISSTVTGTATVDPTTTVLKEPVLTVSGPASTSITSALLSKRSAEVSGVASHTVKEKQIQAVKLEVSWFGFEFNGGEIKYISSTVIGQGAASSGEIKDYSASATVSGSASVSAANEDAPAVVISWFTLEMPTGTSVYSRGTVSGSASTDCVSQKTINPLGSIQGVGQVQISSSFVKSLTATVFGEATARTPTFSNLSDYDESWNCNISGANPAWGCESSQSEPVWSIVNGTTGASVEVWSSVSQGAAPSWGAVNTGQEIEWTKAART
jgi:hypothetical protein